MKRYLLHNNHWIIQEALSFDPLHCLVCLNRDEMMNVNSKGQTLCEAHKNDKIIVFDSPQNIEGCEAMNDWRGKAKKLFGESKDLVYEARIDLIVSALAQAYESGVEDGAVIAERIGNEHLEISKTATKLHSQNTAKGIAIGGERIATAIRQLARKGKL